MSENKVPENIKKLVDDLIELKNKNNGDESKIVEKLQDILKTLLLETELRFSTNGKFVCVKPLEIEAYYYNKGVFEDECVHVHKLQKNRQGKVYIHRYKSKAGTSKALRATNRAGMDLVLSDCNCYALAILIRDAEIYTKNDKGEKQICCSGVGSHPANLVKRLLEMLGKFDYENLRENEKAKAEFSEIKDIEDEVVLFECDKPGAREIEPPSERKNIYIGKSNQNNENAEKFKKMLLRATFRRNSLEN